MRGWQPRGWESSLFALAEQARHPIAPLTPVPVTDASLLDRAYARCEAVIAEHGKTFFLASALLPPGKKRAIRALYAFCRVTDNIVDCTADSTKVKAAKLAAWRYKAVTASPPHTDLVAIAWADTRLSYKVPHIYCERLIDGVARDLHQQRYASFNELATYAYGVASTVGLMMLRIIGTDPSVTEQEAVPYAIKMGLALQVTNILRDVGEDRRAGRVYLPADELRAWGLCEEDLAEGGARARVGTGPAERRWQDFMRFQVDRNWTLYREAWPCIRMFAGDGRFYVAAMCALYRAILDDIEAHEYDVMNRRAHIGTWGKLRRLPGIWWRNR